jgi:hypothetical protein
MQFRKDAISGSLLLVLGLLSFGIAVYFLLFRPALLPEDVAYTAIDTDLLPEVFLDWLHIVFRTWGGFIAGFGCLLVGIGGFLLTGRLGWLYFLTAIAITLAFGRFVFSNIVIGSDFLWFIAAAFGLALSTALVLVVRSRR